MEEMNNFEIHNKAQHLADVYSNYQLAKRHLEASEKLEALENKYTELNKMMEELLRVNKVLQDHIDSLTQQVECDKFPSDWRINHNLEE